MMSSILSSKNLHKNYCDLLPFKNLNNSELELLIKENRLPNNNNNSFQNTNNLQPPIPNSTGSYYIDPVTINQLYNITNEFTFLNINIRSLNKNFNKILLLINELGFSPTIISVTETWLHSTKPLIHSLEGYTFIDKPGSNQAGGVGLFILNSLQYNVLTNYQLNLGNCEDIWVELCLSKTKKITVGCIYRHPSHDFKVFKQKFTNSLESLNKNNKTYIIGGDINIDLLKTIPNINDYKLEIESLGTIQIVEHATRHSPNCRSSLLDHTYTNVPANSIKNHCISYPMSDHIPTITIINSIKYNKSNLYKKMLRCTKNFIEDDFNNELANKLSSFPYDLPSNEQWNFFQKTFNLVLDQHAPLRKQTRYETKRNNKPWINKELLKQIKNKHKLYKKYLINPSESNWTEFTKYRNKLSHLIEQSKRTHFQQKIKYTKSNTRKLWKTVNEIVNLKKPKEKINMKILDSSGKIVDDSQKVSNIMNNYFVSVGENLSKNIAKPTNDQINHLSGIKSNSHSMFLKLITEFEMENYIKNLDSNKSTKSTSAPIKFIKISSPIITPILTKIFNHCIIEGVFPDELKIAEIIPVYKKGDKNKSSNWRPISLLSPFANIFELHIYNQINQFITKHKILNNYQYGFRKSLSTNLAVAQITEDLAFKMQEGLVTCAVFIDLCKAFDTVNHQILLDKLYYYGIRGVVAKLLINYLTNRTQITRINDCKSDPKLITCGVPQGSILGPLLFNLFINDLPNHSKSTTRLFADDACLCFSARTSHQLETLTNNELIITDDWIKRNKLTTNYNKSNYIIFTNTRTNYNFNIKMGDHKLDKVNELKYLGTIIDNKLSWKGQIKAVQSKVSKGTYLLSKLKPYVDTGTLKMIYFSTIYPHLSYCVTSWGGSSKTTLLPLVRLQKRVMRILTNSPYNSHTDPLFNKLKILPLAQIYELNLLTLFHKFHKNKIPMPSNLIPISQVHNYNTRLSRNKNYKQNLNKLNLGQRTYSSQGIKVWKSIPTEFKKLPISIFKLKIKTYLLNLIKNKL